MLSRVRDNAISFSYDAQRPGLLTGLYLVTSYARRSSDANEVNCEIRFESNDSRLSLRAIRPIEEGAELVLPA